MSSTTDEVETMIDDCLARDSQLSEVEQNFIRDIHALVEQGQNLSIRQEQWLESIWNRVTG